MSKYVYKVYDYNNSAVYDTLEEELLKLGEQGWELVSALPIVSGDGDNEGLTIRTRNIKLIFKKRA